ncbi:MAG: fibronectin type III domain-containing protein [Burkholderiales bacterium]|nr:fibronectin type III domain-containing protein [Burkholderiales bacterium]
MQAKIIVGVKGLSDANLIIKADHIHLCIKNNKSFPLPWTSGVPVPDDLSQALTGFKADFHASQTRDTNKIAARKKSREVLEELLTRIAAYVEFVAQGNVDALVSAGFELRRNGGPSGAGQTLLAAPTDFRVAHGDVSGAVLLHVAKLAGAASYAIQTAEGDPKVEANWHHAPTSATSSRMSVSNLVPGRVYWFRVCGINSAGYGHWTEPMSLMVV